MAPTWGIKPEVPTTEDVYKAYRDWYDPEYRNPEYQARWEQVNREEFETWLLTIQDAAWQTGSHQGFVDGEATVWDPQHERTRSPYRKEQS